MKDGETESLPCRDMESFLECHGSDVSGDAGTSCREAGRRRSIASGDRGAVILGRRPEGRGGVVKKAPPCSGCRPGISGPAWKRQRCCCWCNPAEAQPCSWPVCSAGPPTGDAGDPKKPQPDSSSSGAAPAQVGDLPTPSAVAYLLRGHGSRRAVLFASWFGSAASAQPLVISAIDLLQMS